MKNSEEIKLAVGRFINYIKLSWETEQAFEIAYDSVYDIVEKETFLNMCQTACKSHES